MDSVVHEAWLQGGAIGLLTVSGWGVAWVLWRELRQRTRQLVSVSADTAEALTLAIGHRGKR